MSDTLKNCPFCGGKAHVKRTQFSYHHGWHALEDTWIVQCNECNFKTLGFDDSIYRHDNGKIIIRYDGRKEAIEKWNRRTEQ